VTRHHQKLITIENFSSTRIVTRSTRRAPRALIHPALKVIPSGFRGPDLGLGKRAGVLDEEVQQDEQVPRAAVEDAVEIATEMAAQFPDLALDLAGIWESEAGTEQAKTLDLVVDHDLNPRRQDVDCIIDGL
jgi:hypothetical protein